MPLHDSITVERESAPATLDLRERIRAFILENYLFTTDISAVGYEDSLIDTGIVDSTGMLEIILFVEEQLGVVMDDADMVPENLGSISKIARFVEAKLVAA
jgi:acyl carrier protein